MAAAIIDFEDNNNLAIINFNKNNLTINLKPKSK